MTYALAALAGVVAGIALAILAEQVGLWWAERDRRRWEDSWR